MYREEIITQGESSVIQSWVTPDRVSYFASRRARGACEGESGSEESLRSEFLIPYINSLEVPLAR